MAHFKWTKKREAAALALAQAHTEEEAAEIAGVARRTITRWKTDIDFALEVDRLTLLVGISSRAERLRIAKRAIQQAVQEAGVKTGRDVLDWLKFAQSETDGAKLDLAAFLQAFGEGGGDSTEGGAEAGDEKAEQDA